MFSSKVFSSVIALKHVISTKMSKQKVQDSWETHPKNFLVNVRILEGKEGWHGWRRQGITPCTRALDHFDDFYKLIFKKKWPSVRLGLLSKEKKVAVINNLGDVENTKKLLQQEGALNFQTLLQNEKKNFQESGENVVKRSITENNRIDDIVSRQFELEQEKEYQSIYPKQKLVQNKARFGSENNENDAETTNENKQSLDKSLSSLYSDMSKAKFDSDRLILPNSELEKGVLYDFVPASKLRGVTEYISESEYYKYYKEKSQIETSIDLEFEFEFPENLHVYSFDRGDISDFPEPTRCANGVYNFLPVDGAELLTVLCLGLQTGDHVLDMFSKSGNLAYCIFQTLRPKLLACSSDGEAEEIFKNYLYDYSPAWKNMLLISDHKFYLLEKEDLNLFDKILVDVPCTDDRTSLYDTEDNYFAIMSTKARLNLPEFQTKALSAALQLVRPGGTVLYTTSTMSPVQNDGIVQEALKITFKNPELKFTVRNLTPALAHASQLFNFGDYLNLKYGTLVVPFVPMNFGPRYFCKIVRNKE